MECAVEKGKWDVPELDKGVVNVGCSEDIGKKLAKKEVDKRGVIGIG